MKIERSRSFHNEQGSAILIALFALLLISAIGFGLLSSSTTETNINANFRDSQRAYFAARAGLEEARQRLAQDSNGNPISVNPITPPAGMPNTTAGNIIYLKNPMGSETVDPTDTSSNYWDDELCQESFTGLVYPQSITSGVPCVTQNAPRLAWLAPSVTSVLPGVSQADALSYKWVRITTKANTTVGANYPVDSAQQTSNPGGQVCWDGLHEVVISAGTCGTQSAPMTPVWMLTSLAVTPRGSKRMAQMEIATNPPLLTNATVDSQAGVTLQGSLQINSYDNCTCDLTKSPPTDLNGKSCIGDKWAVYSEGNVTTNGVAGTITSGQTGGTPAGTQGNVSSSNWPYDINQLIQKYKNIPGVVYPFGSSCSSTCSVAGSSYGAVDANFNPLTPSAMNPQVTYIPGDAQLTANVTGAGVLVVDGNLDIHGGLEWYGLVLVKGTIDFTGGSSDKVNLYGAFLNGKNITATNDAFGGSVVLQYDSCALKSFKQTQPPQVIASHELMY